MRFHEVLLYRVPPFQSILKSYAILYERKMLIVRFHEVLLYRVPPIAGYNPFLDVSFTRPAGSCFYSVCGNMSSVDRLFDSNRDPRVPLQNVIFHQKADVYTSPRQPECPSWSWIVVWRQPSRECSRGTLGCTRLLRNPPKCPLVCSLGNHHSYTL